MLRRTMLLLKVARLLAVEVGVEFSGFGKQLLLSRMVSIDNHRPDDPIGNFQMVVFQVSEQLFHRTASAGATPK